MVIHTPVKTKDAVWTYYYYTYMYMIPSGKWSIPKKADFPTFLTYECRNFWVLFLHFKVILVILPIICLVLECVRKFEFAE